MSKGKIIVLGTNHRGLWLSGELAQSGFDVTWIETEKGYEASPLDDYCWQLGPLSEFKKLSPSAQEFCKDCFKTSEQEFLQILTPKGPLDLGGPFNKNALKGFFKSTHSELEDYFSAIGSGSEKLISAHEGKITEEDYYNRWVVEWSGTLRSTMENTSRRFHPGLPYLLTENSMIKARQLATTKATKAGVKIMQNTKILDIAREGYRITGIENAESRGFIPCDELVLACSAEQIDKKIPDFSKKMKSVQENSKAPKYVWLRLGFNMKAVSKPEGLLSYSSFVMDPLMPLVGSGFGLMKWVSGEKNDVLTVWCRVPHADTKKQSTIHSVSEEVKLNLVKLIVKFENHFISPIEPQALITADNTPYVYEFGRTMHRDLYKRNLWLAGVAADYSLDLISTLETEMRIYKSILNKYRKEFKSDRALHPARHGAALDH